MHKVVLVTVTKVEAQAVLELFPQATGTNWERRIIGDKIYYALGVIYSVEIFMVQSEMGTSGPGAALLTVHKAIEALSPIAIIMLGIAFGTRPQHQHLGDVLVSKQIQSYEPQKVMGEHPVPRGDRISASTHLLDKFRSGDLDWQGASIHFGLILSGEKLINDATFRDRLLLLEPEAIGGEMEGAGLYTAANDAKVDWILVKAICDWADGNKSDEYQRIAACNAVAFTLHVIQQAGLGYGPLVRVQIILQGDFSSLSAERRVSLTNALAGLLNIPSKAIEVYRTYEGSIVFELGIPTHSIERLRFLLQANNAELRLLKTDKVVLAMDSGQPEEWVIKEGRFHIEAHLKAIGEAEELIEKRRYQDALIVLNTIPRYSSDYTNIQRLKAVCTFSLGVQHANAGNLSEGVQYLRLAAELSPDEPRIKRQLAELERMIEEAPYIETVRKAEALLRQDRYKEALNVLKDIPRSFGDFRRIELLRAVSEFRLGIQYANAGNLYEGLQHLQRAAEHDPHEPIIRQQIDAVNKAIRQQNAFRKAQEVIEVLNGTGPRNPLTLEEARKLLAKLEEAVEESDKHPQITQLWEQLLKALFGRLRP